MNSDPAELDRGLMNMRSVAIAAIISVGAAALAASGIIWLIVR